jgi:hypothetical protein
MHTRAASSVLVLVQREHACIHVVACVIAVRVLRARGCARACRVSAAIRCLPRSRAVPHLPAHCPAINSCSVAMNVLHRATQACILHALNRCPSPAHVVVPSTP